LLLSVLLPACASHYADPLAKMTDRNEGHLLRWAAARQAEAEMPDHPDRVAALKKMAWEPGNPSEFRTYAVDQLIAIDEGAAKKFLADSIVLVHDERTLRHILHKAVERHWVEFVPA